MTPRDSWRQERTGGWSARVGLISKRPILCSEIRSLDDHALKTRIRAVIKGEDMQCTGMLTEGGGLQEILQSADEILGNKYFKA